MLDLLGHEARGAFLDDEALDAFIGHRPDDGDVGQIAVGDPHLGAVDDPVAAVLLGVGLHVGRIGAAVRFGQAEAADDLAAGHARQVFTALLFRTVGVNRVHAQRALNRDEAADAGIAALQLLADQAVADAVQAGATVFFRQRGAQQTHGRDFRHQLLRETALVERLADDRNDLLVGEARHRVLDHALFFREQRADVVQIVRVQGHTGFLCGFSPSF